MSGAFGSRVLDAKEFEKQQAEAVALTSVFGSRVVDPPQFGESVVTAAEQTQQDAEALGGLSVKELGALLKQAPEQFDRVLAAELARPEGPRKQAVRELHAAELRREGGPRAEMIARIEQLL